MRRVSALAIISMTLANGQIRPIDWPFYGGDAQRTGWEKGDSRITKENVKDFQLVLKRKLDSKSKGPFSLTPPVIIGRLISYRGFKELAFVAGASDDLWAIDADMDRMFWQKHLLSSAEKPKPVKSSPICSGAATPSLIPPLNFAAGRAARGAARPPAAAPGRGGILGAGGLGPARSIFAVSSDGKLHVLNISTGDDLSPALSFLPANAKASSLTVSDGAIYTTTSGGCGGAPDAVWAIDLSGADPTVATLALDGGGGSGLGGLALGGDGTVYVQTGNKLLALTPKDLKLKQSFTSSSKAATPVVFPYKGRDLIVSAGNGGRLYLLDSQSLTSLYQTEPLSTGEIWGGLSSWQDEAGTRWVFAPVWGRGVIMAFKVEESNGKPVLTQAWTSRNMSSPEPPVITNGVVFALSAGEYTRDERPKGSTHATLYALDAATGKEMYSTGDQVAAPGNLTGVTVANGRVYFTTNDNTLYAFGIFLER
jgi:outer membrane protein assembly factor BamB